MVNYYAQGYGYIQFAKCLDENEYDEVFDIVTDVFGVAQCDMCNFPLEDPYCTRLDFWTDEEEKYDEEVVIAMLNRITDKYSITTGELEYKGEDDSFWRFVARYGVWEKEDGHIEYSNSFTMEKLMKAFITYIADDLMVTETEYVRDKLCGICGLTNAQMKEMGLDWMLDEEEEN